MTVQILTKNGYTVLDASQGDEASHICKQHKGPIHLMVMDVVMPGMKGRELAKSLASHHPEMKVLRCSICQAIQTMPLSIMAFWRKD